MQPPFASTRGRKSTARATRKLAESHGGAARGGRCATCDAVTSSPRIAWPARLSQGRSGVSTLVRPDAALPTPQSAAYSGRMGPGEVLAERFELRRRIGAGGLAEVFAAHDRVSRGEVAIKILHAHLSEDRDLAERFRREMAVTRGLDHP